MGRVPNRGQIKKLRSMQSPTTFSEFFNIYVSFSPNLRSENFEGRISLNPVMNFPRATECRAAPPSLFCREKGVSVRQWVLGRSIGFRPVHTVLGCQFGPRLGDLSKLDVFRVHFNSSTQILLLPLNCDHCLTLRSAVMR